MAAAEAAESVAARGGDAAFWAMHAVLSENWDALQHDDLVEYAAAVGVDPIAVADDLASGAMRARVRRDVRSAIRSGARTAPAFFVNGRRFDGDWSDAAALAEALLDRTERRAYTTH
jgi:Na+:H+ antiporter, NhaA family